MSVDRRSLAVRVVGRLLALAWLGVAVWRFLVAVAQDHDPDFGGEAQRQYLGLLLLQALCALVAAGATLGIGEAVANGERRGRAGILVLLAVSTVGFALIFTKDDLLAWGVHES